jgi:hypothetical protein
MKRVLLLAALLLALPAHAEWVLVAKTDSGGRTSYVDRDTIKKIGANTRRAWIRDDLAEPIAGALSSRTLMEFDCAEEKRRNIQMTPFSGRGLTGEALGTGTSATGLDGSWEFVAPRTFDQRLLQHVCSQ